MGALESSLEAQRALALLDSATKSFDKEQTPFVISGGYVKSRLESTSDNADKKYSPAGENDDWELLPSAQQFAARSKVIRNCGDLNILYSPRPSEQRLHNNNKSKKLTWRSQTGARVEFRSGGQHAADAWFWVCSNGKVMASVHSRDNVPPYEGWQDVHGNPIALKLSVPIRSCRRYSNFLGRALLQVKKAGDHIDKQNKFLVTALQAKARCELQLHEAKDAMECLRNLVSLDNNNAKKVLRDADCQRDLASAVACDDEKKNKMGNNHNLQEEEEKEGSATAPTAPIFSSDTAYTKDLEDAIARLSSCGVDHDWDDVRNARLVLSKVRIRIALRRNRIESLTDALKGASKLGLTSENCELVQLAEDLRRNLARSALMSVSTSETDQVEKIAASSLSNTAHILSQIDQNIKQALEFGVHPESKEIMGTIQFKTRVLKKIAFIVTRRGILDEIVRVIELSFQHKVAENSKELKDAIEKRKAIAREALRVISILSRNLNSHEILGISQNNGSISSSHFSSSSGTRGIFEQIDTNLRQAEQAGLNAENCQEVREALEAKVNLVKQALKAATESKVIRDIDATLLLAREFHVDMESKEVKQAVKTKVLLRLKPKQMRIKKQPPTNALVVEALSRPMNVMLEQKREEFFQNGKHVQCVVCNGKGRLPAAAAAAAVKDCSSEREDKEEENVYHDNRKKAEAGFSSDGERKKNNSSGMEERGQEKEEGKNHGDDDGKERKAPNRGGEGSSSSSSRAEMEEKEETVSCWICKGSGKTSEWLTSYQQKDSELTCIICFGDAQWGISTSCSHFFCKECIRMSLESMLEQGQFPAFCPGCRAEGISATEDSKEEHGGRMIASSSLQRRRQLRRKGRIEDTALTFLQRRGVITKDLQFRFMKQQQQSNKIKTERKDGTEGFFKCPAKCGNYLIAEKATYSTLIEEGPSGPMAVSRLHPGMCPCGAVVCLKCKERLDPEIAEFHVCGRQHRGLVMDEATRKELEKSGKQCPNCGKWIQKSGGCSVMMCGTSAHGKLEDAMRNGGCGLQFDWNTLKPISSFYYGINGERKTGIPSADERRQVLRMILSNVDA
mmetsp:Transcript_12429/g.20639  ORF Transcript_12429/g.20639 Transcript_12429/m.20639 type:complete len:1077 (+) Transcript_12429:142-3372(+)